jgi:diadenosine tetraphosphatase ApaH/serine/threonine PP2A family protein phosphatase
VRRLAGDRITLDPCSFFFVNPGTVGEPRESDQRAAFAVYDDALGTVAFHRVEYDRSRVLRENARRGLVPKPSNVALVAARFRAFARSVASRVAAGA